MASAGKSAPGVPWLFSPALDLLVGCGGWSLPLLGVTMLLQRQSAGGMALAFYALGILCNQPHYMATVYRAYRTAEDFNRYRFFTVYVAVFALLAAALAHLLPGLFPWLVTLYLTWSPWHYTSQNFGITLMMNRRAGAGPDPAARQLLWLSYAASFAVWVLALHTARESVDPYFLSLRIPENVAGPLEIFATLAFGTAAAAALVRLRRQLPWRALAPAALLTATQFLWFVAPALLARSGILNLPASYFSAGALAFMHCAQYLWITTYFAQREAAAGGAAAGFRFGRYYALMVLGGIALFIPGPWLASRLLRHDFVQSFMIFTALVNLHHFILDGAVWKLRDGRIARLLLGRNPPAPDPLDPAPEALGYPRPLAWLGGGTPAARTLRLTAGAGLLALAGLDLWQYYATGGLAAGPDLARAEALNPADPRPAFRRAQLAKAAGDFPAARRELAAVLRLNPGNAPALLLLGEVLIRANDLPAARAHYDALYARMPSDYGVAFDRGLVATAGGDRAAAEESFSRAARLSPENPAPHLALAEALAQEREPGRAIDEYENYLTLFESNPSPAGTGPNPIREYLDASLAQARLLASTGDNAQIARAARRLQSTADLAAARHEVAETVAALRQLADVDDRQGRAEEAAANRKLADRAGAYAPPVKADATSGR